jgi:methylmalonyl-CoA/ethylmalonyl-CoA epimerase
MKVEKIDHIHARVTNLDGAVNLFQDLLGVDFFPVSELTEQFGLRDVVNPLGASTLTGLHLMEITDPNGLIQQELGHVLRHGIAAISLKVPDIKEAIAELTGRGIKMVGPVHEQGAVKQAWFDPADTFGIQIELCEYPGDDIRAAAGDMDQWR